MKWFTVLLLALPVWAGSPVAPGAALERIAGDFSFTEGPAADAQGNVYFTDQPNDRILKWRMADGKVEEWMHATGRSNGLDIDKAGNIWSCADEKNELWKISPDKSKEVMVKEYEGKLLNAPNDLWIAPDGGIYMSDPFYKRDWWHRGPQEQPVEGIYYLAPDHRTLKRVVDDLKSPNGLIGTPDGKVLYVSDYGGEKTWRYNINKDGTLSQKMLFAGKRSDGMTVDNEGNVYFTDDGVTIFDQSGKQIAHIEVPEKLTANVCFGGKEKNYLFITATTGLYRIKMRTQGVGNS